MGPGFEPGLPSFTPMFKKKARASARASFSVTHEYPLYSRDRRWLSSSPAIEPRIEVSAWMFCMR